MEYPYFTESPSLTFPSSLEDPGCVFLQALLVIGYGAQVEGHQRQSWVVNEGQVMLISAW